jgi:HSP20 family protein
MEEVMNELMKNMFNGTSRLESGKPYVYGFSMKTGPDGKPVFNEFGNVKPRGQPKVSDAREPLVDVMERDKDIIVIAELPGVNKGDIDLELASDSLEIKVDGGGKKYYKAVKLPAAVEDDTTDASYNNGVLEVKLRRKGIKKMRGKKIQIK